jgi:hypothetical protein
MALIDDFKAKFPEIDTAAVDQYFPALEQTYHCYYGGNVDVPCEKEAVLWLIAHLITLDSQGATTSAPTRNTSSRSVGSVSVSYETDTSGRRDAGWYNTTRYGQRFLMLTQHAGIAGLWV